MHEQHGCRKLRIFGHRGEAKKNGVITTPFFKSDDSKILLSGFRWDKAEEMMEVGADGAYNRGEHEEDG
jgi:hypothetical protein